MKKLWIALRMASFHPNKNTNPFHSLLSMRAKHGMISSKVAVVVFSNRRRSPFIFCCLADFFFLFHSSLNWWGAATDCYHFFFSWNCRNLRDAHWKTFSLSIMPFQLKWFPLFLGLSWYSSSRTKRPFDHDGPIYIALDALRRSRRTALMSDED